MFGGFSYDIQINTTNPEDMDNLDTLLNFDWMNHVANQMEVEMAFQMERKYPKEQDRKVFNFIFFLFDCPKFSMGLIRQCPEFFDRVGKVTENFDRSIQTCEIFDRVY